MSIKKLGFIGCGNMGGAILDGIIAGGVIEPSDIAVYDIRDEIMVNVKNKGVTVASGIPDLCACSELVLLAVKPNTVEEVMVGMKGTLAGKALLSIAAGTSYAKLRAWADSSFRILRIMPNTPAMVGAGATVLCSDTDLTEKEKGEADRIFRSVGLVEWLPEKLIDVVTGLSGGGPAYAAMFIEALADGGVREGLPRSTAYRLAAQTVLGSTRMILEKDLHPGALKDMVCSPGGTTIEGVKALEEGGFRAAVINSVIESSEKAGKL